MLHASEQDFSDETAADVGQNQQRKSGKRPAQRPLATPAPGMAPDQQGREDAPRSKGKQRLVIQRERLAEQCFGEQDAAADGQGQQDESRAASCGRAATSMVSKRRQAGQAAFHLALVQGIFAETHENRVQRG